MESFKKVLLLAMIMSAQVGASGLKFQVDAADGLISVWLQGTSLTSIVFEDDSQPQPKQLSVLPLFVSNSNSSIQKELSKNGQVRLWTGYGSNYMTFIEFFFIKIS